MRGCTFLELYQKIAACQRKGREVLMRIIRKYLFPGLLVLLLLVFVLILLFSPNSGGTRILTERQPVQPPAADSSAELPARLPRLSAETRPVLHTEAHHEDFDY